MKKFCEIGSQFLDIEYKLGGQSIQEGLDCFTLIVEYLKKLGANVSNDYEYNGNTIKSYANSYLKNPIEMIFAAVDFIRSLTEEIRIEHAMAGDILFLKLKKTDSVNGYFGIDLGRNNVLMSSINKGTVVLQKNNFKIFRAFRFIMEN
jgi:hypothetical protein